LKRCRSKSVIGLVLCLGLPAASSEQTKEWEIRSEISPGGDGANVFLILEADKDVRGWKETYLPSLVIRCQKQQIDAYVKTGLTANSENDSNFIAVTLRLDKEKAFTEVLVQSADKTALFFMNAEKTIEKLSTHQSMSFRFTPFKASPTKTTFQLAGLDEALKPLRDACSEPPSRDPPPGPYLAGVNGVGNPVLIEESKVDPIYPEDARAKRADGQVILQAIVRTDGTLGKIDLIRVNRPNLGFEESAIQAVKQWRYKPALFDGKPVEVYFTVIIDFSLR